LVAFSRAEPVSTSAENAPTTGDFASGGVPTPPLLFYPAFTAIRSGAVRKNTETTMALKVELKPGERILIGDVVITNSEQRTRLLIEGEAPILREKDIMTAERADSPAKRIYLTVQLMYTSRSTAAHHDIYFKLVKDIVQAAPSTWPYVESINNHILTGEMYKALKDAKKLIAYEGELLAHATRGTGLRKSSKADV
jgi:flagellar biosynthesis repressor protein FlbT